ncbi:unnamed protein product, partial [Prunus brigantina]
KAHHPPHTPPPNLFLPQEPQEKKLWKKNKNKNFSSLIPSPPIPLHTNDTICTNSSLLHLPIPAS